MANSGAPLPTLGNIPLDLKNPHGYIHFWRNEATRFLAALHFDAAETLRQAKLSSGRRRSRLEAIATAQNLNRSALLKILEPLLHHPSAQSMAIGHPVTAKSNNNRLAENFQNIFRDWAWDGKEVGEHLRTLQALLLTDTLGDVCILGAGTGRLAYDLARAKTCRSIVATEINPLLFLIGNAMMRGESIELSEVAELPKSSDLATQKHILKAEGTPQLQLLLTDFLEDRLAANSFDLVITPWFVDVIDIPIESVISKINRLLKPHGTWINFGPLMFQTAERSRLLPSDEWLELVTNCQFKIEDSLEAVTTQLKSPLSATFRTDTMFAFRAQKTGEFHFAPEKENADLPVFL